MFLDLRDEGRGRRKWGRRGRRQKDEKHEGKQLHSSIHPLHLFERILGYGERKEKEKEKKKKG